MIAGEYQIWIIRFLLVMGVVACAYPFYRHMIKGRIICIIFNNNREVYRRAVRPTPEGALKVGKFAYAYRESRVFHTKAFLFGEIFPALLFEENTPIPLNPFTKVPDTEFSSQEISTILSDDSVSKFVNAQKGFDPKRLGSYLILSSLITLSAVAALGYYMWTYLPQEIWRSAP